MTLPVTKWGVTCTITNNLCNFQWILWCIEEIIWLLVQPANLELPRWVTVKNGTSIWFTLTSSTARFNWSCLAIFVCLRNAAIICMFKQGSGFCRNYTVCRKGVNRNFEQLSDEMFFLNLIESIRRTSFPTFWITVRCANLYSYLLTLH